MNEPKSPAAKLSEALAQGGKKLRGGLKEAASQVKSGASRVKSASKRAAENKVREIGDRVGEDVTRKLRAKALDLGVPGFLAAVGVGLTLTAAALFVLGLAGLLQAVMGITWLAQILCGLLVLAAVGAAVATLQKRERS